MTKNQAGKFDRSLESAVPVTGHATDVPTPLTDDLIETMMCGDGIPKCSEWDRLVAHARELERRVAAYRAVATAIAKGST